VRTSVLLFCLIASSLNATCPSLDEELAKKVDIECEHVKKITKKMHKAWMKSAHSTLNTCWTTFRTQKLSDLLQIRKLEVVGHEVEDNCEYIRNDNTTYLHLQVDRDDLDE